MNRSTPAFDQAMASSTAHPQRAAGTRRRARRHPVLITTAISGTMAVVLAGGLAAWATDQPSGSGSSPETAMPASVMVYSHTNVTQGQNQARLLDQLGLGALGSPANWSAGSIGTGLWVDPDQHPYTLVSLPTSNRTTARKALKSAAAKAPQGTLGYVVQKGTTLIAVGDGNAQAAAQTAANQAATANLTGNTTLSGALRTAAEQSATAWIDLNALRSGLGAVTRAADTGGTLAKGLAGTTVADSVSGQLTLCAKQSTGGVDVSMRTDGLKPSRSPSAPDVLWRLGKASGDAAVAGSFSTAEGASPLLDLGSIGDLIGKYLPSLISGLIGNGALGGFVGQLIQGIIGKLIPGTSKSADASDSLAQTRQLDYAVSGIRDGKAVGTVSAQANGQQQASTLSSKLQNLLAAPKVDKAGQSVQATSADTPTTLAGTKPLAEDPLFNETMATMPSGTSAAVFVNVGQYLRSSDTAGQDLASVKSVGIGVGSDSDHIDLTVHSVIG